MKIEVLLFNIKVQEKEDQSTPNTILAQLIDMTRGGETTSAMVGDGGGPTSSSNVQQIGGPTQEEVNKLQKSVECKGCGDYVINQEWILLNHVNTKWE